MNQKYVVENISWSVDNRKILDGISFSFGRGLNTIVGESGAGKSSLMNMLGLIDFPDSGFWRDFF